MENKTTTHEPDKVEKVDNIETTDKKAETGEMDKITIPITKKLLKYVFIVIAFFIGAFWILTHLGEIYNGIGYLFSIAAPFFIGAGVAYIVNTAMSPLERLWGLIFKKSKGKLQAKFKRPVCLTLAFLIVLGIIFAVFFMIIPELTKTITGLANMLPTYAATLTGWWKMLSAWTSGFGIELPEININTAEIGKLLNNLIANYGNHFLDETLNVTTQIIGGLISTVLGLVFSVYMLATKEKLTAQAKTVVRAFVKEPRAKKIIDFFSLCNETLSRFVNGQLIEAVILGALCFIGMLIFQMPYAGVISILLSFTALVPLFGVFIGTAIGATLIVLEDPLKALWFIIFIVVLQQIEGNLIYPRVVGKSVGLPGIWVLLAITVGGNAFGLLGMLFAVPVCSVLYCTFREFVRNRTSSRRNQ